MSKVGNPIISRFPDIKLEIENFRIYGI